MSIPVIRSDFWQGKRVLLTGHTGFKGAWLAVWLHRMGAEVTGLSLPSVGSPNLFSLAGVEEIIESHLVDICDVRATAAVAMSAQPEIVFHLSAQALVRASYRDPLTTFSTNVLGTASVLDALRKVDSVKAVVAVTTDKVYQNLEHSYPFRETDRLGGHDPYSASKAASELVIASYRESFLRSKGVAVASARAGNVIGGGDWSEDRLIPDAVRAWNAGFPLEIRRPSAIRPWQHVLEALAAYLQLARKIWDQPNLAGAYNFGPQTHAAATVKEVISLAQSAYGRGQIAWGDGREGPHEAGCLTLETTKARQALGVEPAWPLNKALKVTMDWYRAQHEGAPARGLCEADIAMFEAGS